MFIIRRLIVSALGIGLLCFVFNILSLPKFTQQQLAFMPATTQLELFKQRIISPVDVVKAQIAQFKKTNKKINAVTFTHFKIALKQAKIAEEHYKSGTYRRLEGITVGVKDEHYDKGWVVTQGSLVHKNDKPKKHADTIVQKLKQAGAILLIQTTVPELYLNFTTATKAWGVTRNPWNLQYTVGGSSGGSGAALAAGYVTLATGSDMGGSIRIPAAFCGVYGFKPPFGNTHTELLLSHFSGTGPMARTFEDMVLMQNVISGPGKYSANVVPAKKLPLKYPSIKGMKIAYVGGMGVLEPSKAVQKAMDKAIEVLREQGAIVKKVNLDLGVTPQDITNDFSDVALSGAMGGEFANYADKQQLLTSYARYFVNKAVKGDYGKKQLAAAEAKIKAGYKHIVDEVFAKGYQVMILPTLPTSNVPADYDFTKDKLVVDGRAYPSLVGGLYTVPFNLLNWMPVVSVPVSLNAQGMPMGMQIVGKAYEIDTVFQVAYNYSKGAKKFFKGNLMPKMK